VGAGGGGLGYSGLPAALAIEFDTWYNAEAGGGATAAAAAAVDDDDLAAARVDAHDRRVACRIGAAKPEAMKVCSPR
jgi:hypothetical protein